VSWRAQISAYLYVPFLAFVALLQIILAPHLSILGAKPDLMLLTVAAWGLLSGARQGFIWGFVGGVWVSLVSGAPFGTASLVLMAVGSMAGVGQFNVYRSRVVLPMLVAVVASLLHGLLWLLILYLTGQDVDWLDHLGLVTLPSMMMNALLVIPIYAIMRMLQKWTGRQELSW
jgi:rod shape-determining protein MreD